MREHRSSTPDLAWTYESDGYTLLRPMTHKARHWLHGQGFHHFTGRGAVRVETADADPLIATAVCDGLEIA